MNHPEKHKLVLSECLRIQDTDSEELKTEVKATERCLDNPLHTVIALPPNTHAPQRVQITVEGTHTHGQKDESSRVTAYLLWFFSWICAGGRPLRRREEEENTKVGVSVRREMKGAQFQPPEKGSLSGTSCFSHQMSHTLCPPSPHTESSLPSNTVVSTCSSLVPPLSPNNLC